MARGKSFLAVASWCLATSAALAQSGSGYYGQGPQGGMPPVGPRYGAAPAIAAPQGVAMPSFTQPATVALPAYPALQPQASLTTYQNVAPQQQPAYVPAAAAPQMAAAPQWSVAARNTQPMDTSAPPAPNAPTGSYAPPSYYDPSAPAQNPIYDPSTQSYANGQGVQGQLFNGGSCYQGGCAGGGCGNGNAALIPGYSGYGGGCGSGYGGAMNGGPCYQGCGSWYAAGGFLYLARNQGNKFWTTYETGNNPNQLVNTQNVGNINGFGGQVTVGKYFGCCCNRAIETTIWGLAPQSGTLTITAPPGGLSTPIDNQGSFIGGTPTGTFFDASPEHRLSRYNGVFNFEANVLALPTVISANQRMRIALLSGFRYFYFSDQTIFGSVSFGNTFGSNGGANEAYLNVGDYNNLVGWQIGSRMAYAWSDRFSLFATPKIGIYNNFVTQHASLYSGNGITGFDVHSTSSAFATLGELDLGGQYYITPRLSVFAAYRLLGVGNIAWSDSNFQHYMADVTAYGIPQTNGNLWLQGVYTGAAWNF